MSGERDDYYDLEGCCLTCEDASPGCLCYECNCTKCEQYDGGACTLANTWRANNLNLLVHIYKDGWIFVKFDGPINKSDYSKIRPFFKEHYFAWDPENKRYELQSSNPRFVKLFIDTLHSANFTNICFLEKEAYTLGSMEKNEVECERVE